MAKVDIYNLDKKYDILYTDPPWQQSRGGKKAARPNSTGMSVPYQTMTLKEIEELHKYVTENLLNERHNVFMWAIDKYLPETEAMMKKMGYKLHARIIWDKHNGPSPAFTLRFSHEYLLWFYKPGKMLMPAKDKRGAYTTVFREASRAHSQKPECVYKFLEKAFPSAERLELFARNTKSGFDCWGNEV